MTSCLLYTLAQLGFKIDILSFGMNVVMDVINLSGELSSDIGSKKPDVAGVSAIDLSKPVNMEG